MKNFFTFFFILISSLSYAQKDTATIPIPMKNGIVFYEKTYPLKTASTKAALYTKALKWFKESFQNAEAASKTIDQNTLKLTGTGDFKVTVSESGNYYWLKPVVDIIIGDKGYTFKAYNYYEKPVEKGITNDYSKIEYRWWDFRQGKPWSVEDRKLFEGLNQQTLSLMASLEKAMTKQ